MAPTPGFQLVDNVVDLDPVWKDYILNLWDERSGRAEEPRPLGRWARLAAANGDFVIAKEHFEKAVADSPDDAQLAIDFARLLHGEFKETDRASKIVDDALSMLDAQEVPDEELIGAAERLLAELDPKAAHPDPRPGRAGGGGPWGHREVRGPKEACDDPGPQLALRLGVRLERPLRDYAEAVVARGEDLTVWDLAYNEENLDGWTASSPIFKPNSTVLDVSNGGFDPEDFDFRYLTYDRVTGGDMSITAEVQAEPGSLLMRALCLGSRVRTRFMRPSTTPPARARRARPTRRSWT